MSDVLFPHEKVRPVQDELLRLVSHCVEHKKHCVIHAPTGLGKTAAALAPALTYALDRDLTVVFVTPRHTQHLIALRTARAMKERHNVSFMALAIVGKRNMCAHNSTSTMRSDDFAAYCKGMRETGQCAPFINARSGIGASTRAKQVVRNMEPLSPLSAEQFVEEGRQNALCPYELALYGSERAKLIITDYHYLFNPAIRDRFLARINKRPEQLIVIVDEGHNLPARVRECMTHRITSGTLHRALDEAKRFDLENAHDVLVDVQKRVSSLAREMEGNERLVKYEDWEDRLQADIEQRNLVLDNAVDVVQESNKKFSSIASVQRFMNAWYESKEDSFARILERTSTPQGYGLSLTLRCLDPAIATSAFVKQTHCTIMMSGTLRPTEMFVQQLGFPDDTIEKEFPSPFPNSNKLCMVYPGVTTKYSQRNDMQYKRIAQACAQIVNSVPGCSAIFFPSYALRDSVEKEFQKACEKTVFREHPGMTKMERAELIERFSGYKDSGAVLLGVTSGSFGEGVDMPGVLKAVIVVGIPLDRPNLETQQLISYYDKLCGKGWDYGYTLPALMRTMQNAGRCIRSETDKGVLVFMDERYLWPNYKRVFPDDWLLRVAPQPVPLIEKFFQTA